MRIVADLDSEINTLSLIDSEDRLMSFVDLTKHEVDELIQLLYSYRIQMEYVDGAYSVINKIGG